MRKSMKARYLRLARSAFVRNVTILATGTALAQILMVVASPILSRLYGPEDFGVLGAIAAVALPVSGISCLKYELAVIIAPDDREATEVMVLSLLICMLFTVLTLTGVVFAGPWIATELNISGHGEILLAIPIIVLAGGCVLAFSGIANRKKRYGRISLSAIVRTIATLFTQIGLALIGFGAFGLVIGRIVGPPFALLPLLPAALEIKFSRVDWLSVLRNLPCVARTYSAFPLFNAPKALLRALSVELPTIFLAILFSPAAAGLYWFTYRLLHVPTRLVGDSIRKVFYQKAATLKREHKAILPSWRNLTLAMSLSAVLPAAVVTPFMPTIFAFVFGPEWYEAGKYAQWLIIWWCATFCSVPSSTIIPVLGLQAEALMFEIGGLILRVIAIIAALVIGDALLAIALFSMAGAAITVALVVFVYWKLKDDHRAPERVAQEQNLIQP